MNSHFIESNKRHHKHHYDSPLYIKISWKKHKKLCCFQKKKSQSYRLFTRSLAAATNLKKTEIKTLESCFCQCFDHKFEYHWIHWEKKSKQAFLLKTTRVLRKRAQLYLDTILKCQQRTVNTKENAVVLKELACSQDDSSGIGAHLSQDQFFYWLNISC